MTDFTPFRERKHDEPLGHWLNNPGNLRYEENNPWNGQLGHYHGWCVFNTVEHGCRAMMLDVRAQQTRHGAATLAGVIERYAPASDGNDPAHYARLVGKLANVFPNATIDLRDRPVLDRVAHAMSIHEIGGKWAPRFEVFQSVVL